MAESPPAMRIFLPLRLQGNRSFPGYPARLDEQEWNGTDSAAMADECGGGELEQRAVPRRWLGRAETMGSTKAD